MKTFIFALIAMLGMSLGAPSAEARDKDRDRKHYSSKHHSKYSKHDRNCRPYRSYPRSYSYRSYSAPRYYSYPRAYSSYRTPYYGNRYSSSRRPSIVFSFGL